MLQNLLKIIVLPMVDLKALLHGTARADQLDSSDDGNQSAGGYGTRAQPGFSSAALDIQESEQTVSLSLCMLLAYFVAQVALSFL